MVGYGSNAVNDKKRNTDDIAFFKGYTALIFCGRAWITEPKTGITLQAEVTNRLKTPNPFYSVTLSKAFQLDKLAGFFSPITDR